MLRTDLPTTFQCFDTMLKFWQCLEKLCNRKGAIDVNLSFNKITRVYEYKFHIIINSRTLEFETIFKFKSFERLNKKK